MPEMLRQILHLFANAKCVNSLLNRFANFSWLMIENLLHATSKNQMLKLSIHPVK